MSIGREYKDAKHHFMSLRHKISKLILIENEEYDDYPSKDLLIPDGLVAYYPFDGNANDYSENKNHGTEFGGFSYTDGIIGRAVSLDGVDDYVVSRFPVTSDSAEDRTICAWIYMKSTGRGRGIVHMTHYDRGNYTAIGTLHNHSDSISKDSVIYFGNGRKETSVAITKANVFKLDRWYHLAGVVKNHKLKLYIDGSLDQTHQVIFGRGGHAVMKDKIVIGKYVHPKAPNPYFHGIIDEVRIYNRALTNSEIRELVRSSPNQNRSPKKIRKTKKKKKKFDASQQIILGGKWISVPYSDSILTFIFNENNKCTWIEEKLDRGARKNGKTKFIVKNKASMNYMFDYDKNPICLRLFNFKNDFGSDPIPEEAERVLCIT